MLSQQSVNCLAMTFLFLDNTMFSGNDMVSLINDACAAKVSSSKELGKLNYTLVSPV